MSLSWLHVFSDPGLHIYCLLLSVFISGIYSQNTEMWRDFKSISDVNQAAVIWLLTLEKQGCSTMLQAGIVYLPPAFAMFCFYTALTLFLFSHCMKLLL